MPIAEWSSGRRSRTMDMGGDWRADMHRRRPSLPPGVLAGIPPMMAAPPPLVRPVRSRTVSNDAFMHMGGHIHQPRDFPPPPPGVLPEWEIQEIFNDSIRRRYQGIPQESPMVLFIAGQQGSGKTSLERSLVRRLGFQGVSFDADDLFNDHPHYDSLARENDRTVTEQCLPVVARWDVMTRQHIRNQRCNAVISAPLAGEVGEALLREFRADGYRIAVAWAAVPKAQSQQGILDRYLRGRQRVGYGRWLPIGLHDATYANVLRTADLIDRTGCADIVHVIRRGGEIVHTKALRPGVGWSSPEPTRRVIERERHRLWTEGESSRFQGVQRRLMAMTSHRPELRSLVEQADRRADGLLARPQPLGYEAEVRAAAARSRSAAFDASYAFPPSRPHHGFETPHPHPHVAASRPVRVRRFSMR